MPTNPPPNSSPTDVTDSEVSARLKERFNELPKIVQDAITSANIQKQLRAVSENHKLHVDQWGALENEVTLTLLGFQEPKDLAANIQSEVGISAEEAATLAVEVNKIVFEPIRQELERGLAHPEAKEETVSDIEQTRRATLAGEAATPSMPPAPPSMAPQPVAPAQPAATTPTPTPQPPVPVIAVQPATPPQPKPTEKAERAPISSSYTSRQPSTDRKSVTGDPYRELPQ